MLGTGNALVTKCYNTCFVIEDTGKYFMVDCGGGNQILHQLNACGYNWKDMREIFITHKHIDHFMGIVWMMRMICQSMAHGDFEGEANIYGHDEVISLVKETADKLLQKKTTRFIGESLHLIKVIDGETKAINGRQVTFF